MTEQTKEMVAFGEAFSEQSKELERVQAEHEQNVKLAAGSPSELAKEEMEYHKALSSITDEILKRDAKLRLTMPFNLTKKLKEQIQKNVNYYVKTGVIEVVSSAPMCEVCGKAFRENEVFIEDDKSAIVCCLDECTEKLTVDGNNFRLKVYKTL